MNDYGISMRSLNLYLYELEAYDRNIEECERRIRGNKAELRKKSNKSKRASEKILKDILELTEESRMYTIQREELISNGV